MDAKRHNVIVCGKRSVAAFETILIYDFLLIKGILFSDDDKR